MKTWMKKALSIRWNSLGVKRACGVSFVLRGTPNCEDTHQTGTMLL